MSSYTNTHILECNRRHSPEYNNTQNTAIWTNAVNDGIKLDIGDEISLHSAFISDLGAEDSTIEFKGEIIQESQTFQVSKVVNASQLTFDTIENNASELHPRYFLRSDISTSNVEIRNIKDTDANVLISFFKSNNGENMFHLPIKFIVPESTTSTNPNDSWKKIRTNASKTDGTTTPPNASHRYADDYNWDTTNKIVQHNVDGSRYMIFGRDTTHYIKLNGSDNEDVIENRDLFSVNHKYIRIRDLLQLKAPVGFNSPSEISNVITDGLQRETQIEQNTINYELNNYIVKKPIGAQNETPTNKLFPCATYNNLNVDKGTAFYGKSASNVPASTQDTNDYETGFQYIGIKRPEIYETGIEVKGIYKQVTGLRELPRVDISDIWTHYQGLDVNVYGFLTTPAASCDDEPEAMENINTFNYDYANNLPFGMPGVDVGVPKLSVIHTNMFWTEQNLNLLKDFFDSQARYPELFDMNNDRNELLYNKNINGSDVYAGDDISVDTHRYLHINTRVNSVQPREIRINVFEGGTNLDADTCPVSLGNDNIPNLFNSAVPDFPVQNPETDYSSAPLFIKYFKDNASNTDINEIQYTYDANTGNGMWGGFAIKSPPSLVPIDNGSSVSLKRIDNIAEIINASVSGLHLSDRISFLAHIPYAYLQSTSLKTFHNSDGSASDTIQTHNVYTLGKIDWYTEFFNNYPPPLDAGERNFEINYDSVKMGFDSHPTAYGNSYIGLYNGLAGSRGTSPDNEYSTGIDENHPLTYYNADGNSIDVAPSIKYADAWLNKIYCGAIAPELSFDTTSSRFAISSLHSPERITPKYDATLVKTATSGKSASLSQGQVIPVPDNSGNECYKINKVFDRRNFCPTITPYYEEVGIDITGTTNNDLFAFPYKNPFVKENAIIDSHSGIFIEDFNIEQNNWNNSFWGICGFKYSNLNNENTGNINGRVFDNDLGNIAKITTNAMVNNDDLLQWRGTATGVPAQKYQTPYPTLLSLQHTTGHQANTIVTHPPMEVLCDSVKIEASNLPTKTLRPYFIIRSDILSDSYYFGGQNEPSTMPVLSVIPKESQYGDYYYSTDTTTFTITHPRTITRITTEICDPSGKPSNLSPNSAVLYKVVKQKTLNNQIYQQVLQATKSKK